MSKKLNDQIKPNTSVKINDLQFQFLKGVDTVQRSTHYYHDTIKTEYLRLVAIEHGYSLEDDLEFSIDLNDDTHELTIKKLEKPAEEAKAEA